MVKMSRYRWINFILIAFLGAGCFVVGDQYAGLPPGPWRAVLRLDYVPVTPNPRGEPLPEKLNLQFEEVTAGELPFNFEVVYDDEARFHIELINAGQRIRVDDILIGKDRTSAKDTLLIRFPGAENAYIRARYEQNVIEGEWVIAEAAQERSVPFVARYGKAYRFTELRKTPAADLSGRWRATFGEDQPTPAVGEFQQKGNYLTGAFSTPEGDYRHLEGTVQADKVYLSSFDGRHAYLFEGKILPDGTLIGSFRSGRNRPVIWQAQSDPGG
jgi:hypothetical protein